MRRYYLVGYMGAGKTTLGKHLAREMGLSFIDLDSYIENRFHKSVSAIFAERGEAGFRKLERDMLEEVSAFEDVVISTGGGTPCFFDNMELMKRCGTVVYLSNRPEVLFSRLRVARSSRPIIANKSDDELFSFIAENLAKREPAYSQATLIFDANRLETRSQIGEATRALAAKLREAV